MHVHFQVALKVEKTASNLPGDSNMFGGLFGNRFQGVNNEVLTLCQTKWNVHSMLGIVSFQYASFNCEPNMASIKKINLTAHKYNQRSFRCECFDANTHKVATQFHKKNDLNVILQRSILDSGPFLVFCIYV